MSNRSETILSTCGREVGPEEIEHVREVADLCSGLSRNELALTLCEHWSWVGATGSFQVRACVKLLERLEGMGAIRLPARDEGKARRGRKVVPGLEATGKTDPSEPLACELSEVRPVRLEPVRAKEEVRLWNEYVERYHALGAKYVIGCSLRYFIAWDKGRLGCILMGCAARALAARDKWIGWTRKERLLNLPRVINNQRLLLFPWVRVPHLASHVLGQLGRRVAEDWERQWGYRPVLMETFVDGATHQGVSYRAAGWELVGETSGKGIRRGSHEYTTTPKMIFVRPLAAAFRDQLCALGS